MNDKQYLTSPEDYAAKHKEAEQLKKVAFVGVTLSTVAVLCAVLVVPMLYNHMQYVQSALQMEVDYCKSHSSTLRQELGRTKVLADAPLGDHRRVARQYAAADSGYGGPSAQPVYTSSGVQAISEVANLCCTCHVGGAGVAGAPGPDGRDGNDGPAGNDGAVGAPGTTYYNPCTGPTCVECPIAAAGDPGPSGLRGPKGLPGDRGIDADGGVRGADGPMGAPGLAGVPGVPGGAGLNGGNGVMRVADAPQGPPGMMGQPGIKGVTGPAGVPGRLPDAGVRGLAGDIGDAGPNGVPGARGLPGGQGITGDLGSCAHCPPPRTAPGY